MIKMVGLLRRADHLSREEFHRWWLETHVPLAKQLPGLRKYVVSLTQDVLEGEPEWDGIAELWFDDEAALKAALYGTRQGETARADTAAHVGRNLRFITHEHRIID